MTSTMRPAASMRTKPPIAFAVGASSSSPSRTRTRAEATFATCQREGDDESAGLEDTAPIDVLRKAAHVAAALIASRIRG